MNIYGRFSPVTMQYFIEVHRNKTATSVLHGGQSHNASALEELIMHFNPLIKKQAKYYPLL